MIIPLFSFSFLPISLTLFPTSCLKTTYQFDVLADHGEKALDMFSHFFISPLFTKSGTQREVQAVDRCERSVVVRTTRLSGRHRYSRSALLSLWKAKIRRTW